jgi:hypothetical protein
VGPTQDVGFHHRALTIAYKQWKLMELSEDCFMESGVSAVAIPGVEAEMILFPLSVLINKLFLHTNLISHYGP